MGGLLSRRSYGSATGGSAGKVRRGEAEGALTEHFPGQGDGECEDEADHPSDYGQTPLDPGEVTVMPGDGFRCLARVGFVGASVDKRVVALPRRPLTRG